MNTRYTYILFFFLGTATATATLANGEAKNEKRVCESLFAVWLIDNLR